MLGTDSRCRIARGRRGLPSDPSGHDCGRLAAGLSFSALQETSEKNGNRRLQEIIGSITRVEASKQPVETVSPTRRNILDGTMASGSRLGFAMSHGTGLFADQVMSNDATIGRRSRRWSTTWK